MRHGPKPEVNGHGIIGVIPRPHETDARNSDAMQIGPNPIRDLLAELLEALVPRMQLEPDRPVPEALNSVIALHRKQIKA